MDAQLLGNVRYADSYSRMPALLDLYLTIQESEDREWFELLGREWDRCDNIGHLVDHVRYVLDGASRADLDAMMDGKELEAYQALPRMLTIYRGCYEINRDGLSWSLSRDSARRFPFLARYSRRGEQALLLTGRVDKRLCVLKLGRDENEIIAASVQVTATEVLTESG